MQRITISLDDRLAGALEEFLQAAGYTSRSEGMRDIVRDRMGCFNNERLSHEHSVANLSYIYDRRVRQLASRLSELQHAHHDLIASTTSVPLDHSNSLECVMLKGKTIALRQFADCVGAERGVRSVLLNLVGVEPSDHHEHEHEHTHTGNPHLSPTVT